LENVPEHECFVEVFGGAAGVLVNKDPEATTVEVYNDADGDLVHFFEVLREKPDELVEWLDRAPYAREAHNEWADLFYNGYRPRDDVKRAGQFFHLRYSQWGAGYATKSGFGTSKVSNSAQSYANKRERLDEFANRFDKVVIENLDWEEALAKYDQPETVFYCDPPYVDKEDYYPVCDIDHAAFVRGLKDLDARWLVSYEKLPGGFEDFYVIERGEEPRYMGNGKHGESKRVRERLVMNFDPSEVAE
jgi:DNA adenine methylase